MNNFEAMKALVNGHKITHKGCKEGSYVYFLHIRGGSLHEDVLVNEQGRYTDLTFYSMDDKGWELYDE